MKRQLVVGLIFIGGCSFFLRSQESKQSTSENYLSHERLLPDKRPLRDRRGVTLTVDVPPKDEQEEGLPPRCLPTPSVPQAPTGTGRFSWTPDTPTWKKPFIWLKDSTGAFFRYVFD